ncbi:MAG: orotate phosphoribosyltransferase [Candidatus Thermoplasmatota archaeon]|jgi:orotate phosphoribosyltransferase|nr:orotate phosphoribosyltransferase [Candidatus Thermoplasmatota archaeon]MCL5794733.1 orotate phosphoribosyltransferase [Candidatus Thermoplasmatota archaeon]
MLSRKFLELGAIKFGKFTLTSGKVSDYYVDIKEACTYPDVLRMVAESIAEHISGDMIAGVELGAVPLIVATSMLLNKPYTMIRKEVSHGTKKLLIGQDVRGKTVDVVEDVVTTGGSVMRAISLLTENEAIVKRVICVVDREEGGSALLRKAGIELIPVLRISELIRN